MTSRNEEQLPEASDSSGHTPNDAPKAHETVPLKHKSISCTQCRKRKLKCDRGKPSCGTCSRLHHQCVYPEGRMKSTAKRRNVKDLEARLAQVETLLSSEVASKQAPKELPLGSRRPAASPEVGTGNYWDDLEIDMIMANDMNGGASQATDGLPAPPLPADQYFSNELIGFGLQENFPPREMIDELHDIYFARAHLSTPTIQKYRYLANVRLLPPLGPPICLRYAIWALAASVTDKFSGYQEVFYQRARKYAEIDEMKGHGEQFITVNHAQCWSLLSMYEAQTMYFLRAWVSAGRCIRLVQMMNLHHIDGGAENAKEIIPPARDWTELEERRRTFWAAFCCDRYSCAGTGWPMTIDERDITTHLPASEEAFEQSQEEGTTTLSEAMTAEGAGRVSPYAGVVLMACLIGHNWLHLHRPGPNDHPGDFVDGEFWKRHRKMDNVLSNTFMFLPERLRLPAGLHNPNIVYLNMNIHASTICLHQVAILKAEKHGLDSRISKQSQARCRVAAQEIVNIMRLISHFNVSEMSPWVSFNLYIATGVLIEGCHSPETSQESRSNLDFLLTALQVIGRKHVVTLGFIAQLKIDLESAGIGSPFDEINHQKKDFGSIGTPAIDVRSLKSRVVEFSADISNQSQYSTGVSSSVNGGSETCNTPDKDSESPLQDFHRTADLRGVLPKQSMTERLCRATQSGASKFNHPKKSGDSIPKFFNIPALLEQYNIQGGQESAPVQSQGVRTISAQPGGQQLPFLSTLASQPQFIQSGSNETDMEQDMSGSYTGTAIDGMPPEWAFGPIESSVLPGFSGFDLSSQEGEDINYLLNGAPWNGSTFQT